MVHVAGQCGAGGGQVDGEGVDPIGRAVGSGQVIELHQHPLRPAAHRRRERAQAAEHDRAFEPLAHDLGPHWTRFVAVDSGLQHREQDIAGLEDALPVARSCGARLGQRLLGPLLGLRPRALALDVLEHHHPGRVGLEALAELDELAGLILHGPREVGDPPLHLVGRGRGRAGRGLGGRDAAGRWIGGGRGAGGQGAVRERSQLGRGRRRAAAAGPCAVRPRGVGQRLETGVFGGLGSARRRTHRGDARRARGRRGRKAGLPRRPNEGGGQRQAAQGQQERWLVRPTQSHGSLL